MDVLGGDFEESGDSDFIQTIRKGSSGDSGCRSARKIRYLVIDGIFGPVQKKL